MVPCDTNAQLYGSHGNPFSNIRLPWLFQPKRLPTSVLHDSLRRSITSNASGPSKTLSGLDNRSDWKERNAVTYFNKTLQAHLTEK